MVLRFLTTYTLFGIVVGGYSIHKNLKAVKTHKPHVTKEEYKELKNQTMLYGGYNGLIWPATLYSMWKNREPWYGIKKIKSRDE